jgi:hypothetical protein
MKATRSVLAALTVFGLAGACTQASGGEDDPATTAPAVVESKEPPVYAAPVLPAFEAPGGFTEDPAAEFPFKLGYDNVGTAFFMDGADAVNAVYITAYLLPEDLAVTDYEERVEVVLPYDDVAANEVEDDNTTRTLTHGYAGVFRYAVVRDGAGLQAYQRNTFVFDGQLMVQLTCQWRDEDAAVKDACATIETTFTIPSE